MHVIIVFQIVKVSSKAKRYFVYCDKMKLAHSLQLALSTAFQGTGIRNAAHAAMACYCFNRYCFAISSPRINFGSIASVYVEFNPMICIQNDSLSCIARSNARVFATWYNASVGVKGQGFDPK